MLVPDQKVVKLETANISDFRCGRRLAEGKIRGVFKKVPHFFMFNRVLKKVRKLFEELSYFPIGGHGNFFV